MNCNEAKDIILTDYIDHELDESMQVQLKSHVDSCQECRSFALEVKNKLVQPFENIQMEEPPQEVWNNIEDIINPEVKELGVWGGLKKLLNFPRPVLAFNMVLILAIMLSVFVTQNKEQKIAVNTSENEIDVLAYVIEETDFDYDGSSDFGTAIEEYFL